MAEPIDSPSEEETCAAQCVLGFQRVEAELRAIPERSLMALNLDVPKTVAIVLGAWPKLLALRDQVARLPDFDMNRFDKLRDYAWALAYAHRRYRGHAAPPDNRAELRVMRQRAFTLLVSSYDEARRALSFLRWHERDLESIAPSLWSGRGARPQPKPASSCADVEQPEAGA